MIRSERVWPRIVAHADMDAFYAAIEQLDDPSLRGRPLLVGPPSARGVVLTASYEARPYGVGSAMPMAKARRLCPNAVIVPPRFDRYQEVSATIMRVFSDFSPDVEALSLDEAFLEMTGSEQLFGDPKSIGRRLKAAIRDATGGSDDVGRPIGNQIRGQGRKRLPKAGWVDCRSARGSQSLACSTSRVMAMGCRPEDPSTPSPARSAYDWGRGARRSAIPFCEARTRWPALPHPGPSRRSTTGHWTARIKEHRVGTYARRGCT